MPEVARLYTYFHPNHYNLELDFKEEKLEFAGTCQIFGEAPIGSNKVKLHSKDLDINEVIVNGQIAKFNLDDDELEITLPKQETKLDIKLEYNGKITKPMHGIYPSYDADGKVIFGTQFESHHAREAFPCIDEPEAKATFDVTLKTKTGKQVLGNMPIKQQVTKGSKLITSFDTTPVMSTYLVAFVFGELQYVSAKTNGGTEITVYSAPHHDIEALVFPLEVATKTIEFLNEYFDVEYPLPKLDQVALPDFSSGAMENWGLVTYREIALLADPDTISTSSKEFIATVIAHELSHQWFGNLVTMEWWDDLWLNESFATLMEYLVIDALYPEWNVMLSFASHEALSAYRRDILPGVQAVATPVNHPDEISTLFDPSIVYAKGARLLWMAYNLVGDKAFRKGLGNYFKRHAYGNTTGQDLWEALGQASGLDVSSILEKWVITPGLPYLTVEEPERGRIKLTQSKLSSEAGTSAELWSIPLWPSKRLGNNTILDDRTVTISDTPENVRFNTVGGHYVVNYRQDEIKLHIAKLIKANRIKPDGRLLLLHDSLILARCGVSSVAETLEALSGYKNEDQEAVWSVISLALADARMLVEGDEDDERKLKNYTYDLISQKLNELGWEAKEKDSSNDRKLRATLVSLAVYTENQAAIKTALDVYRATDDIEKIPADIRGAVLTCAAKHGTKQEYLSLLNYYPDTANADIQLDIAGALCATKDPESINTLISKLKDQDYMRLQDIDRFLVYTLRNRFSRAQAWQWMVDNWGWLTEKFASDKSYDSYPRYAASAFSTQEWLDAFIKHFDPLKEVPALTRNIEIGTKDIQSKIAWRKKDQANLKAWLRAQ